jgi:hypothetical protein
VRRSAAVVAIPLALALGVVLLLLARDMRSWHHTLRTDAARADASPQGRTRLTARTALPSGLSAALLDVGRDRRWLASIEKFNVAYGATRHVNILSPDDYQLLNGAEASLSKITQDPNPARASQAYNLLSVLVFREAYPGTVVVRRLVQESLTDVQNAVRLDPADEPAKENLELTLRVLISVDAEQQQARTAGTRRANAKRGGFEGPPGAGY